MISFESGPVYVQKLRERMRTMSDEQLVEFGKLAKSLCGIRVSGTPDPYKVQSDEARAEWRRRHPRW
jgi:hypothetical protein